jgi:ankyrin repeat protein
MASFIEKKGATKAAKYADMKKRGYTDLMIATLDGNLPLVRELVKSGVDLNEFSEYSGAPALLIACKSGELEIARELIENGADITALDINGYTALMHASDKAHLDIVKLLLKMVKMTLSPIKYLEYVNTAVPDEDEGASGFTALMFADKKEVVRELIKFGADVNHVTKGELTALLMASRDLHNEVVTELCENGANVNAVDSNPGDETDGYTPLHYAASHASVEMIKTLCKYGANVNAKDANGLTALMHTCIDSSTYYPNDYDKAAKELIRCGANVHLKSDDGSTALDLLKGYEDFDIYTVIEGALKEQQLNIKPKVIKRRARSLVSRRNRRNIRLSEENLLESWEGRSKKRHTRSLNRR